MPLDIIENLDLKKPSFGPSKWPRKLKPAKNSKLPKWSENCFEPFGKGGLPSISTWISTRHLSEGDLEEKKALILEDKAPGLINQYSKVHMTS